MVPRAALPAVFKPMLATLSDAPFDSPEHLFEVKWDGVRTLAFCDSSTTRLYSRSERETTATYSEFSEMHRRLKVADAVLDGEIIAMSDDGRPSFELIQQRIGLVRPGDVRRGQAMVPLEFVVFDVVFADGEWLKDLPLSGRMELLDQTLEFDGPVRRSQVTEAEGVALFNVAVERGLEGIVAKRAASPYVPGRRSRDWTKIKGVQSLSAVVGGWTPGDGSRSPYFGALLMGMYDDEGRFTFVGAVGTGFKQKTLAELRPLLDELRTEECPFHDPPGSGDAKRIRDAEWVTPAIVCEVEYREITSQIRLRAPSFKGFRTDLSPRDSRLGEVTR